MTTRERRDETATPAEAQAPEAASDGLREARDSGDAFLLAADEAITRALSGTPETFLAQNRQMGGQ
jgi:hypothetical protein